MVAGARYVVEKKIPGRRIDFECLNVLCRVMASKPVLLAAAQFKNEITGTTRMATT